MFNTSRLLWLAIPLLTVAVASAPEWPARAQMLESPAREWWFPLAQRWEASVSRLHTVTPRIETEEPIAPSPVNLGQETPASVRPAMSLPASTDILTAQASTSAAPHPNPIAAPSGGTVLMVGDSLMGGVVAGLRTELPRQYTLVDRHKVSTGLSNRQYFDWPATARQAALETQPDWVVIHLGGNDGQDILYQGRWLRFGGEEWAAVYRARAEELIAGVRAASPAARVVWLGLPAMRPDRYEAKSLVIAAQQRAAAAAQGVDYVDGRQALGQSYSKDGVGADGRRQIWRLDDGIHYTRAGGGVLGKAIGAQVGWPIVRP